MVGKAVDNIMALSSHHAEARENERRRQCMFFDHFKPMKSTRRATILAGCGALALAVGIALLPSGSFAQDTSGPIVTVTGGQVQGQYLPGPGGAVFKGIPYAAPPVGALRWRETQPVKPWSGVKQTIEYGPGCPAAEGNNRRPSSEDCLYLNVWAPAWPVPTGKKLPVMFWINGGELYGGSASLKPGSESLTRHGVILVSANYRGQLFGMVGHPELTAESPHHASGNYMFYDEIAALKWVHANIASFGGDPNNVTVFGQSGGAHFISMFLTSPFAKGLINRAIVESGAVADIRPYLTLPELEQMGILMAQALNAPTTGAIQFLRSLPASRITSAMPAVRAGMAKMNYGSYDEGIDGYTVPQNPPDVYRAHQELAIPLMVGNTALDSGVVNAAYPGAEFSPDTGHVINKVPQNDAEAAAWAKSALETYYGQYPGLLDEALKAYGIGSPAKENLHYAPYGTLAQQIGSDINHRCGTRVTANWHSTIAPTWEWEFSRSVGTPAHHGSELTYVFGTLSKEQLADPNAVKVRDQIQTYWTNFAKTGNPNGAGMPKWPQFNAAHPQSIEFVDDGAVERTANRAVACAPYIEKFNRDLHPMLGGANRAIRPGNLGQSYD